MKYEVIKWGKRGGEDIRLIRENMPNEEGELAIRFATHFGIIAAKTEGQDEAGRAKLELQTVEETVKRSCDLAQKLTEELKKRGWMLDLPTPKMPEPPEETPER